MFFNIMFRYVLETFFRLGDVIVGIEDSSRVGVVLFLVGGVVGLGGWDSVCW